MSDGERIAALEAKVEEHDKKLDDFKQLNETMIRMACSIETLAEKQSDNNADIKEIKNKVNKLEDRPGKISLAFDKWLFGLIGAAIVTGIIALVTGALF